MQNLDKNDQIDFNAKQRLRQIVDIETGLRLRLRSRLMCDRSLMTVIRTPMLEVRELKEICKGDRSDMEVLRNRTLEFE